MKTFYLASTIIFNLIVVIGIAIAIKGLSADRRFFRGLIIFLACILVGNIHPLIIEWIYHDKEMNMEKFLFVSKLRTIPEKLLYIAAFLVLIITLLQKARGKDKSSKEGIL